MYSSFFGFSEKPFEVTPDPKYLYSSPSHQETLASLVYGIRERRGFICVTGEVGTGKTMIINAALDRLDENTKVAYMANTSLAFDQLLLATLQELGILQTGISASKMNGIRLLNEFTVDQLSKGGNVVLIIDEAHNLDADSMENLRLLSNLETRKHKLIQIVLAGQPELDEKLGRPEVRQLAQRITMRRMINPLTEEETYAYIRHRLNVAGCEGSHPFGSVALEMIYEYSKGIPRKINILCDNALLIGYALKKRRIGADCVAEAAKDLKWDPVVKANDPVYSIAAAQTPQPANKRSKPRIALAASMVLAAGLVVVAWIAFGRSGSTLLVTTPSLSESSGQAGINPSRHNKGQSAPGPASIHPAKANLPQQASAESVANPKRVTSSTLDDKQGPEQTESLVALTELEKQKGVMRAETASEPEVTLPAKTAVREKAQSVAARTVVAQRNDNLSKIIQRAYGRYKDRLLAKVLKENPEILTPDFILAGQVIRLPDLEPMDLND